MFPILGYNVHSEELLPSLKKVKELKSSPYTKDFKCLVDFRVWGIFITNYVKIILFFLIVILNYPKLKIPLILLCNNFLM